MSAKHSKLPWVIDETLDVPCRIIPEANAEIQCHGSLSVRTANAALIVHRVNNWQAVVDALDQCHEELAAIFDAGEAKKYPHSTGLMNKAKAALDLAKGETV